MYVCGACFDDPGLVSFIWGNASATECSFCPTIDETPIAAPVDDVSEYFIECLSREYDLAVNKLGWIGSEGGYIGQHWYASELALDVLELEFPQDNQEELLPHLFGEHFEEHWCERDPYGLSDSEWTRYSWERFCHIVMYERRFFFLGHRGGDDTEAYSPGEVLTTIFDYADRMGLFRELPAGSQLIRARCEDNGPPLKAPQDLGPPPAEKATQANRMSPVGIPMFYACEDEETALKESSSGSRRFAVGKFKTLRPITILDLVDIPPIPSLFESVSDGVEVLPRRVLTFLHHVAEEMSRPIERDGRVHISYVPTQVVTEFIRDQVLWDDTPIDGVRYESSVHPGHASYVLFANQANVESTTDQPVGYDPWLKLVGEVDHVMTPDWEPRSLDTRGGARMKRTRNTVTGSVRGRPR